MSETHGFVGREKEIRQLAHAYRNRRHVLIAGPDGIGKTALLRHAQNRFQLMVCEETSSLRRICESLERHLGWTHRKMNLVERKNRLLPYLARRAEPVALDAVALTSPRVARFIQNLIERIPVWIACRSSQPDEIGHVWQYLHHFERIELPPLFPFESGALVRSAISANRTPSSAGNHTEKLHRIARGNPRALKELLTELLAHDYDLDESFDRKLLDLDRRIHSATELAAAQLADVHEP